MIHTRALALLLLVGGCGHTEQIYTPVVPAETTMQPAAGKRPAPTASPRVEPGASAKATAAVDPAVIKALEKMGAFLRELRTFAIKSDTTTDEVLDSGQKIQFSEVVEMWVRRPDRLRVNIESERKRRQFFYDGKTFTIYGARVGYYASFEAPPTLGQLIDVAERRFNIEMPLVDLFYWGTDKSGIRDIKAASLIGPSKVGDVPCDHYALKQDDVDWQIWIERGERTLPRKLVITSKREQGQPQFTAVLGYNLQSTTAEAAFTFVPPQGAKRITFEEAKAKRRPGG